MEGERDTRELVDTMDVWRGREGHSRVGLMDGRREGCLDSSRWMVEERVERGLS